MGQIDAAEGTMPVAAVALAAVEMRCGLGQQRLVDRRRSGAERLEPIADRHHAGIHLHRFRVAVAEVSPAAAAEEAAGLRQFFPFARQHAGSSAGVCIIRSEGPFGHLAITTLRQPERAAGGHLRSHF